MRLTRTLFMALALMLVVSMGAVSAQDQTTIMLAGWSSSDSENAALQAQIDAFQAANPDVAVELNLVPDYDTFMQTGFASGDYANVFYVDSSKLQDWASAKVIAPIGDQLTNVEGIYESLRSVFTYDGQLYCPAKDFSTLTLQYNIDMFDAAGVAVPTTWEELAAAAEALTTADVAGLTVNPELARFLPFLYQSGGAVLDAEGGVALDSDATRAAVQAVVDLFVNGYARTATDLGAGWAGEAFGQGKVAMAMEGNWVIQYLEDNFPDLNWGVAELPAGPAGKATMAFTVCYGVADPESNVSQTPEALAASIRLVDFLTGDEGAMMVGESGFGPMPTRGVAAEPWLSARGEAFKPFVDGAEYAYPWSFPPGFGTFIDTFNTNLVEATKGNLSVDEFVTSAAEAAQEAVDELN